MTMTTEDEELFLAQQLLDARHRLEQHKKEMSAMRFAANGLEARVVEAERALFDYCEGNGVRQFKAGSYTVSIATAESVNIPDPDAVPAEFQRVRSEPNKVLIREVRPLGNWYNINSNPTIRIISHV